MASSTMPSVGAPNYSSSQRPHVVQLPIFRQNNGFVAEIGVGTPPQKMNVTIDTGSSLTWIRIPGDELPGHIGNETAGGTSETERIVHIFDTSASSSYRPRTEKTFTAVRNQHSLQGYQSSESLTLDNVTIPQFQMSMVQKSTMDVSGVLGIGYPSQIPGQSKKEKKNTKENTILDRMAKEGKIRHGAYSLHLDGDEAESGSISFGGMDTDKFIGPMKELPVVPHTDSEGGKSYQALQVMMTGLDLPEAVFDPILEFMQNSRLNGTQGAIIEPGQEEQMVQFVDCKVRESLLQRYVTFVFGGLEGAKIEIPIRSLIRKAPGCEEKATETISENDDSPRMDDKCACYLAMQKSPKTKFPKSTEIMVLGDAIIRYAYIVCDLQNNKIGMAQRNFISNKSNVVEFAKKMKTVPGAQQMKEEKGSIASRFGVLGPVDPILAFWTLMVLFGAMVGFA